MSLGLQLSLVHGLTGVVPVLERFRNIKVLDSLSHLHELTSKSLVILGAFEHGLPASSHDFALVLLYQFGCPISHVFCHLCSLEPFSTGLTLSQIKNILVEYLLLRSEGFEDPSHGHKGIVGSSELL